MADLFATPKIYLTTLVSMPSLSPLIRGRAITFLGILFVALGLRDSATAVSPILASISVDIPFQAVTIGLLGMVAPVTFAIFSLLTPVIATKLGLEWSVLLATGFIALGEFARALSHDTAGFLAWSIVTMAGTGAANVLLPPLVKKFFPDRIPAMSTVYLFAAVVGSVIPAYLAGPLAESSDWRVSISMWGYIAAVAIVPWALLLIRERGTASTYRQPFDAQLTRRVWSSLPAWGMSVSFGIAAFNCYIMWGWLPIMLQERTGMTQRESGSMLALYTAMALLTSLLGPGVISKMRSMTPVLIFGMASTIVGALGLWFVPHAAPALWSILSGFTVILFTLGFVLINLRTSNPAGAVALSGMVQAVGYSMGALGPLIVGLVRSASTDWTWVFVVIIISALTGSFSIVAVKKKTMVDA